MARQRNEVGGGARTNENGLHFEQTTDLHTIFRTHREYSLDNDYLIKNGNRVGLLCEKHKLYKYLLTPRNIDYKDIISKKLLPDEAILVNNCLYIIEKKFQGGAGSVDEKLQTCDFKKKQYAKLLATVNISVEYIYVLNDWFRQDVYRDVHEYIISVGCKYFFNEIPLCEIGLGE
ncbi:MAG: hypothetical protein KJ571_01605 [Bacteroidetes bacterium]|nr:hypothetical protein [Bacteroidota bacterium]